MNAIVFGGSGFLGSHVGDALSSAGYNVTIFDIHLSKYLKEGQKMIVGDIMDSQAVNEAVKGQDVVYNFAAIADINKANEKPIDTIKQNILGNTIILEACRLNDVKRFVFASSVYVYSNVASFYRSSKQACESIIENYQEVYCLPYTILRYGSLYGPRADETNWIYSIMKQALNENKITRFGDGEELREYIHVEDAAKYSVEILAEEFENKYIILTGSQKMKIKDFLLMIKEMLGNRIEIEYLSFDDEKCPFDPKVHYTITPYAFTPKRAIKYTGKYHIDLGEGILQYMSEIQNNDSRNGENS